MKRSTSGSINMLKESSCHSFLKMQIFFLMFFILISLSFQEILQFPSTEHSILLSLKQHWSDSKFLQSWDLKFSPCGWSGVTCIYGISIVKLDLEEKRITGTIPSTICQLKNLTVIDLSNNNISGAIPASLRDCSKLQHLDLSNNSSTGQIPGVGVAIQLVWIFYMVRKHCSKMKNQNSKEDLRFITFHKLKLTKEDIVSSLKDENVIGHGGSGKVYRMAINQTGDTFAVKSIGHDKRLGEKFPKDFLAEIRIIGLIRHRNIVKLFCCISSTDKNLLVYEYFEKQSLDKWLRRKKRAVSPGQSSIPSLDWCSSRTLLHAPRLHSTHHS